jgi:hypothetical protein
MKLSTVDVALMAVFAALQALLSYLPFTIAVGVSGFITLGVIGGSLIGILLGPVIGGSAVLIGSLVGVFINPQGAILGIFTIIPPSAGAFGAGCIRINRGYLAGAVILLSLAIFYANPLARQAYLFPWLQIVAMIIAFSPIARIAGSTFKSAEPAKSTFGIALASFIGVMTDHASGSAIGAWYLSLGPEIWNFILPIYPFERIVALVVITIIAVPVYSSLKRMGILKLDK